MFVYNAVIHHGFIHNKETSIKEQKGKNSYEPDSKDSFMVSRILSMKKPKFLDSTSDLLDATGRVQESVLEPGKFQGMLKLQATLS